MTTQKKPNQSLNKNEWKTQEKPFENFDMDENANKNVELGANKPTESTGMYKRKKDGVTFYIKKTNPADDFAEVLASIFSSGAPIAKCEFVKGNKGTLFVASECFNDFKPLSSKKERGLLNGWLKSNPITDKNKDTIYQKLKTDTHKQDLANILVYKALINDNDCHAGNIGFYTEQLKLPKKTLEISRIGNIDHGWGFADICKENEYKVNLFDTFSPIGSKATHGFGGIPTNHFKDYLKIINSKYFMRAIQFKLEQFSKQGSLEAHISESLEKTIKMISPIKQPELLFKFAEHIGLEIDKTKYTNRFEIKKFIIEKLSARLKMRLDSLALINVLLQIKLKMDANGDYLTPEARLLALKNVIETRFAGRDINACMPSFDPPVKKLLTSLLKEATKADSSLRQFCEEIQNGRNPVKHPKRQRVKVSHKETLQKIEALYNAGKVDRSKSVECPVQAVLLSSYKEIKKNKKSIQEKTLRKLSKGIPVMQVF